MNNNNNNGNGTSPQFFPEAGTEALKALDRCAGKTFDESAGINCQGSAIYVDVNEKSALSDAKIKKKLSSDRVRVGADRTLCDLFASEQRRLTRIQNNIIEKNQRLVRAEDQRALTGVDDGTVNMLTNDLIDLSSKELESGTRCNVLYSAIFFNRAYRVSDVAYHDEAGVYVLHLEQVTPIQG